MNPRIPAQRSAHRVPRPARKKTARPPKKSSFPIQPALMLAAGLALVSVGICLMVLLAGLGIIISSERILPGVKSIGVSLGNQSESDAAARLAESWSNRGLVLRDGDRTWAVSPVELGISLDAQATAAAAAAWGRSEGGVSGALHSLTSGVEIDPVLVVDLAQMESYLQGAESMVDLPPVNAGVRLDNGQVVPTPASEGRSLDIGATVERVRTDAAGELADGALDLVMNTTAPTITDASPLVAQANMLLSSPFTIDGYDPIRDEWVHWSAPPETWSQWLSATSAPGNPTGLLFVMNAAGPTAFLQANAVFTDERYIDLDKTLTAMQDALARSQTSVTVRVWHHPTTVTVGSGQTLAAIAEEVGIPYPYIQAANPDIDTDALSVGQVLQLPSKDVLVPLDPIPNKRIIVSRSQQHLWAYENGQIVFDWVISTGIASSPTALGVFQIQSHELNAYADQWNLYMPHFMGFYHPGPNVEVINGFHGFPTRGGGYLLWTDDLGTPVTYGCVLLGLENAETLYNWAPDGVVVEVRA